MSRIAFAQWNPANLRKLQSRIIGLLNEQIDELLARTGVLPQWIYKATVVGNTCMHHVLLGIDPTCVGLVALFRRSPAPARAIGAGPPPQDQSRGARLLPAHRRRLRRRRRGRRGPGHTPRRERRACGGRRHRHQRRGRHGDAGSPDGLLAPAGPRWRARRSATACGGAVGAIDNLLMEVAEGETGRQSSPCARTSESNGEG